MEVSSDFDDHLITVEDAQSGVLWHFAAGKTKGFRFIGAQTNPPSVPAPNAQSPGYAAAETVARAHAKQNGWI